MPVNIIPFFSDISSQELISEILNKLEAANATILEPMDLKRQKGFREQQNYFFVGTGGTEHKVTQFLTKTKPPQPIYLLSYDKNNSLPAAMEIRSYLEHREISTRVIHDSLDNLVKRIEEWNLFLEVLDKLKNSVIGVFGKKSPWLIASDIDRDAVTRFWGVKFKNYSLKTLLNRMDEELWEEFQPTLDTFLRESSDFDCSDEDLQKAAMVAQALQGLVNNHDLDALTIECFKLFEQSGITGCYALSHLNSLENVSAGCEGDLPSTFTMMLGKYLTNQPTFMVNVADVNPDNNSVIFAHCTVPTTILESYKITSHYETGKSVAIQGRFPFREITVFKVFGPDLSQFWVSEGVITRNLSDENRCRTQVRATLTESVSYFLDNSLANHHVIIPGKHKRRIQEFFTFLYRS